MRAHSDFSADQLNGVTTMNAPIFSMPPLNPRQNAALIGLCLSVGLAPMQRRPAFCWSAVRAIAQRCVYAAPHLIAFVRLARLNHPSAVVADMRLASADEMLLKKSKVVMSANGGAECADGFHAFRLRLGAAVCADVLLGRSGCVPCG
jgi:hypothetical protein